jgi:hypothetical protein
MSFAMLLEGAAQMQLLLGTDELNLIANVLMEREADQASAANVSSGAAEKRNLDLYEGLLNKVLARDTRLDSEELVQLADMLADQKRTLKLTIAQESRPQVKAGLQEKLTKLERVLEKVEEACVMF